MKQLPKEFIGRTARAILFIGLVIVFCAGVSSAGLLMASRFGLTRSREQVPLTALSIGKEGSVELPQRGKMIEGDGWKLRNSRDIYTLTLDNAVIESISGGEEAPLPAISVTGDLNIDLKKGSGNWITSDGPGIRIEAGTLVIRGEGGLEVRSKGFAIAGSGTNDPLTVCRIEGGDLNITGGDAGIAGAELELAGGSGVIAAEAEHGLGICVNRLTVEDSVGSLTVRGNGGAAIAAKREPVVPDIKVSDQVRVSPQDAAVKVLRGTHVPGQKDSDSDTKYNMKTFTSGETVIKDELTGQYYVGEREITFEGK